MRRMRSKSTSRAQRSCVGSCGGPRCSISLPSCGDAYFWGRELTKLGHEFRLLLPDYVKRQKNDAADAEAFLRDGAAAGRSTRSAVMWALMKSRETN